MNIKEIEELAVLARIELHEGEKEDLLKDIQGILEYVKMIETVEIPKATGSMAQEVATGHYNIWREDKEDNREFSKEGILGQFPDAQAGFLKVKKIL